LVKLVPPDPGAPWPPGRWLHRDVGDKAMRQRRTRDDRGAAAVEFALIAPFVLLLLFGMISTGMTYTDHLSVSNAVREGARFGSAIDYSTSTSWATSVRDRVKQVYNNSASSLTDAEICVKLVKSDKTTITGTGMTWTGTSCGTAPDLTSFTMTTGSCAVVVWVKKPETINLMVFPNLHFNMGSKAISYYGLTVGTTCTAK
jgi:Flp pilus assembly protein TadG